MVAHSALAAQFIQSFSFATPFVLAGDFNCRPTSLECKLLTTGRLLLDEKEKRAFPSFSFSSSSSSSEEEKENNCYNNNNYNNTKNSSGWSPSLLLPLKSAYFTRLGKEPDFTNFAQTMGKEKPFQETIDYLFHSDVLEVIDVLSLPSREEEQGGEEERVNNKGSSSSSSSFPNEEQPSDHLMIAATFCFPWH
jgi:endonuclease/exonuclease/phosphatase family metal-dependent hydrolase